MMLQRTIKYFNEAQAVGYYFYSKRSYFKSSLICKGLNPNWGSKQHSEKRKILHEAQYDILRDDAEYKNIEDKLQPLRIRVKQQGDIVRNLKTSRTSSAEIKKEVDTLKLYKKELEELVLQLSSADAFDKARMVDLIRRRFYYDTSFSVYGGIAGQFDYGPMGCEIIDNILAEWQKHFVIQERMLKVNCSSITPEIVLRTSGHVEKFTDYIVKDKTGECFRLDHLIKEELEKLLLDEKIKPEDKKKIEHEITLVDGMTLENLKMLIDEYNIKSPNMNSNLEDISDYNLMFPVSIGPSGSVKGYLRPETAQGIFVNFKKLLEYNQGKLPFACAQIGSAFRNEATPQSSLLRVREFTLAEIEHFCDPSDKTHAKFSNVSDTKLWLYSSRDQTSGERPKFTCIGEAVQNGLVANETLGYYMARIQQFLIKIGIHPRKLRFRQHMCNEMAHYAKDCWDAECLTSYGWTECVGCADRSAYDLSQHSKATGMNLWVERPLKKSRMEEVLAITMNKKAIRRAFADDADSVLEILNEMNSDNISRMDKALDREG